MSRVADALRKSRDAAGEGDPLAPARDDDEPWGVWTRADPPRDAEVPWDLPEPVSLPKPVVASPAKALDAPSGFPGQEILSPDGNSGSFTQLVQRIFRPGAQDRPIRSILFTPVGAQNASTSVCAHTGDVLAAQTGQSVCLVDADLRTPTLHTAFRMSGARGLSDALLNDDPTAPFDSCVARIAGHLWMLPAGGRCAEALPHLTSDPFRLLLLELSAAFEYVLILGPSLGANPEAALLGQTVDGVVLVLQANATRREAAKRAADHLRAGNVRILGAILGSRTFPIPEAIYRRL
jgi:Mrp family chromosome partitioning ATPase